MLAQSVSVYQQSGPCIVLLFPQNNSYDLTKFRECANCICLDSDLAHLSLYNSHQLKWVLKKYFFLYQDSQLLSSMHKRVSKVYIWISN